VHNIALLYSARDKRSDSMRNWQGAGGSYGSQLAGRQKAAQEYHSGGSNPPPSNDGGGGGDSQWGSVWGLSIGAGVLAGAVTGSGPVGFGAFVVAFIALIFWFRSMNKSH